MKFLILLLLFPPCLADSDHWFRYIGMPIAAAAYSVDPNQCWSNMQTHPVGYPDFTYSIYRQYSVKCESLNDTCFAYIAIKNYILSNDTSIYFVFRGTNNNYAFIENGWNFDEMVPFISGGKVSKVFFDAFNAFWYAGLKDDLLTLKNKYSIKANYNFIGHSIGGAIAALAAGTFEELTYLDVLLYTFGQPRIGDKDFADNFSLYGPSSKRIVHKADIVPHLPPLDLTVYYHFTTEYWYDNDMSADDKYVTCKHYYDGEVSTCSDSIDALKYNMEDHKYYFGRDFVEYGKNGCVWV